MRQSFRHTLRPFLIAIPLVLLNLSACSLQPTRLPLEVAIHWEDALPGTGVGLPPTPFEPAPARADALILGPAQPGAPLSPPLTATRQAGMLLLQGEQADAPLNALLWLTGDQAIVRLGASFGLVSLESGAVTPIRGYEEAIAATPDGTAVILGSRQGPSWLIDVRTGERWKVPSPIDTFRWLSPTLGSFGFAGHASRGMIDLERKMLVWDYPDLPNYIRLQSDQTCFGTVDQLTCRRDQGSLIMSLNHGWIDFHTGVPAVDPDRARIAFVDRLGSAKLRRVSLGAVAYARERGVVFPESWDPWVDTLVIYDPAAGLLRQYPLPEAAYAEQVLWSPDGARVGVHLHPSYSHVDNTAQPSRFLVLDLATKTWTRAGEVPLPQIQAGESRPAALKGDLKLERLLPDHLLLRRGDELLLLSPDGALQPWRPGSQPVEPLVPENGPLRGIGPDHLLMVDQQLLLDTAAGEVFTWPLGGLRARKATISPDHRWAAVQTSDNRLVFLRRP